MLFWYDFFLMNDWGEGNEMAQGYLKRHNQNTIGYLQTEGRPPSSVVENANRPELKCQLCHLLASNTGDVNHSKTQFLCLESGDNNNTNLIRVLHLDT